MVELSSEILEFHRILEGRIRIAAGTANQRTEHLTKISFAKFELSNDLRQMANAEYVSLMESRDDLYKLFPDLREQSTTLKDHNLQYW